MFRSDKRRNIKRACYNVTNTFVLVVRNSMNMLGCNQHATNEISALLPRCCKIFFLVNGWGDKTFITCWLSSMSSTSPLRVTWDVLRTGARFICLGGGQTLFGAVGDVLMGPRRRKTQTLASLVRASRSGRLHSFCNTCIMREQFPPKSSFMLLLHLIWSKTIVVGTQQSRHTAKRRFGDDWEKVLRGAELL